MSRGFTLVETIVAIGILTGGLVTLAHVLSVGVHVAAGAEFRSAMTIFAQQKLEEIRATADLADTDAGVEHRDTSGAKVCDTSNPCADAFVTARWSIAPVASYPELVAVRVVVSHARRSYGEVHSFAIRPRRIR